MELLKLPAVELAAKIKDREIRTEEAAEAVFAKAQEQESQLNCYVTMTQERAMERARNLQKEIDRGALLGPLAGVPVAVKDNLCTEGIRTTCSSAMLESFIPSYSAEAVRRLEEAGGIVTGKTNMDEFAMGSTTETSYFGPSRNPWNPQYVPGGSSGGSAAAVSAGECFAALGSDTGGSIRQPAACCGVVGMKPTYGAVSRYGLIAYGSSLDQAGPIARNVTDCAALLQTIASHDCRDATSVKRVDMDFMSSLTEDVRGLRVGIPLDYFDEGLDPEVAAAVLQAAGVLRGLGAVVEDCELGLTEYAVPAYYTIASAEASSNLERFDGMKYGYRAAEAAQLHSLYRKTRSEGFGPEVKRRIMLGSFVLSSGYYDAYYLKALKVKALIRKAFDDVYARYDILLGPVSPHTAPRVGESLKDPLGMYLGDIYTVCANLAGFPAISLPCGMDDKGLPIGLQLMADCFREHTLFRAAYAYEQARGRFPLACERA